MTVPKDFGSNGIRLGCIISQKNDLFLQALEGNSYFTCPSSLSDSVSIQILSNDKFVEDYIETNISRLAANYDLTTHFLDRHGIPYQKGSNAGLFIWINLFAALTRQIGHGRSEKELWTLEMNLQTSLLKHKVFLASGKGFGSDKPGWFRIVFAHRELYLAEGLRRIVQAVEAHGRTLV